MRERFSVQIATDNYSYDVNRPLVDDRNNFLRGYSSAEMTRLIEVTETTLNPGKTNAPTTSAYLFFDAKIEPFLEVNIPAGVNKYHCRMQSCENHVLVNGKRSGYYPDKPSALKNSISLHLAKAMDKIQALPMTFVYQIGMNNNHVGIVALRLCSLDDPGQNEIMVINSLSGYRNWENAAINGLVETLQNKAAGTDRQNSPQVSFIKPETYNGVTQSPFGMKSSCAGIVAAMSCAISSDSSFAAQQKKLVRYMRSLCGQENEAALRRDHQKLLAQPHPLDGQFNDEAVKKILRNSKKAIPKVSVNLQHNFLLKNSSSQLSAPVETREAGWEMPTWLKTCLLCVPVIGWLILLVYEYSRDEDYASSLSPKL